MPNLAFVNIAVDGEKSSFIIFINNIILTVTVWCLVGYILDKFSFLKVTYLCFKTSFYDYIYDDHCSSLLLKVSSVSSNALHSPCLHVQHCPPDHHRTNLCHLLCDVGLQLVEAGMAWAVHLGLKILPEAETLDHFS